MSIENVLYYLFLAGMFFVMMRFGCGAHIMGHGQHHAENSVVLPEDEIDPVCGMNVKTATAKTTAWQGRIYHFCSQNCREKFEASPVAYAGAKSAEQITKEKHHGY